VEISRATEAAAEGLLQATELAAQAVATGLAVEAEEIVSEGGISPVAVAETEMLLEEVLRAIADRALAPTAVAVPPAWDLEAEAVGEAGPVAEAEAVAVGAVEVGDGGNGDVRCGIFNHRSTE